MRFRGKEKVRIFSNTEVWSNIGKCWFAPGQTMLWGTRLFKNNKYSLVKVVDSLYRKNFKDHFKIFWDSAGMYHSWTLADGKDPAVRTIMVPNNCIEVIGETNMLISKKVLTLELHTEILRSNKEPYGNVDLDALEELLKDTEQDFTVSFEDEYKVVIALNLKGVEEIPAFTASLANLLDDNEKVTGLRFKYVRVVE